MPSVAFSPLLRWGPLVGLLLATTAGCAAFGRRDAVSKDVVSGRELSRQGVASMELGEWKEAETLLSQAIDTSPTDATSRHHLAEVLWQRGATSEALLQIEAAAQLDSTNAALLVRGGEMLLATGATDKALERAESAIGLDSHHAAAWALRGRVRWQQEQTDLALADLQRALQYAPGETAVLLDVAALYRQREEHQRCLTTVQHLLDSYSPGEEPQLPLLLEGMTLADLGRWHQSAESLRLASERGPPNAEVYYHLARAEWHAGRPAAASTAAGEALAANAAHQPTLDLLAQLNKQAAVR